MQKHKKQRLDILKLLYAEREAEPKKGWVYLNDLNKAVGDCEFALTYLTEREYIKEDGYQYRISALGMDFYEAQSAD